MSARAGRGPAIRVLFASLLPVALAACTAAPSIAVFGAGFPSWLFCILIGVTVAVAVHVLAGRAGFAATLSPVAVTYPLIASLAAMLAWLLFFAA